MKELLTIVLYDCYPAVLDESFNYISKKALDPMLSIIKNIKNYFSFSGSEDGKSGSPLENFLDYLVIYS